MLRRGYILVILVIGVSAVTIASISAEEYIIPSWIKNTANFWVKGAINDKEFLTSIEWLIENNLIKIESDDEGDTIQLSKENQRLQEKNAELCGLYISQYNLNHRGENPKDIRFCEKSPPLSIVSQECFGNTRCFTGIVTKVIDGDTIEVDNKSVRLALVNTPEEEEHGYDDAREFVERLCPINTKALVDEDDKQTGGSYGRIIGVVYCNDVNLNEEILRAGHGTISTYFCSNSEFENHGWAKFHGC